mgnify:FL=1
MLGVALGLGVLLAMPQLLLAWWYAPRSIRASQTASEKQSMGNCSPLMLLRGLLCPRWRGQADGVFHPEINCYIGYVALGLAWFSPWSWWHGVLLVSVLLAMGKHTPLFRWTHWGHLRIPARYCYGINLSLAFLAIQGFHVVSQWLTETQLTLLVLLQAWDLAMNVGALIPTTPYCQRWEQPARVFNTPLTRCLMRITHGYRVSGLSYPLRTGQVNRIRTLGYNGGSQAQWMAAWRGDTNPFGSGAHDWFQLASDSPRLDQYGVKYAITRRPLRAPKWRLTSFPHVWENHQVTQPIKDWHALREARHPV